MELVVNLHISDAFGKMKFGELATILEIAKSRTSDILSFSQTKCLAKLNFLVKLIARGWYDKIAQMLC